jgi:AmiR/NasT family two-component response regulator
VVTFAEVAVGLILHRIRHVPRDVDSWLSDGRALHRAEVHQATGVVAEQLGIGMTESLARLRAYAYAQGKPLIEIAREVVTRRLRLSTDTPKRFIPRP